MRSFTLCLVVAWAIPFVGPHGLLAEQPTPLKQEAPEPREVTAWLNGPPQKMAELRGRVVVVHFQSLGCVNCARNYPWYKSWHKDLSERGVTIIGIHSPETEAEKDIDKLREHVKKNGLTFPIAVDNKMENWRAWGNRLWPCVYLVDKRGVIRWRWNGELKYGPYDGNAILRRKIDQLLKE